MRGNRGPQYHGAAHGKVAVWFVVDTLGRPVPSTIRVQSGTDPQLEAAIREVVPEWRYSPAIVDGCKARQQVLQHVQY